MRIAAVMMLFLLIVSCKNDNKAIVTKQGMPLKEINKSTEICDTDFDIFFEKFKADSVFQKRHIKFPLKNSHLEDDYNKVATNYIPERDYTFSDFNSHKDAMKQDYDKFTVEIRVAKDSVDYLMRGYDNGIYTDVKFAFIDGCWYLTEIKDRST